MAAFELEEGQIVLMSNKVGTTTFAEGYGLSPIDKIQLNKLLLNPLKKIHLHLLVRHPLSRVLSVFESKTKKDVANGSWDQHCQKLICEYKQAELEAKHFLLSLSLHEFVCSILPSLLSRDHHFMPQSEYFKERIPNPCRSENLKSFTAWNNVFKQIKLDGDDFEDWAQSFGLDPYTNLNQTARTQEADAKTLKVIKELYAEDYRIFGY